MKIVRLLVCVLLVGVVTAIASAQDAQTPEALCSAAKPGDRSEMQFDAPEDVLEDGVDYRAIICTDVGPIYVDLFEDLTPITVNSFVFLAQQGYFDNTTFHRVLEGFMAQGGDPTGTGRGGPGYQFQNEPVSFLQFDRPGLLAMANAGADTNGSQFFITFAPAPSLNFGYTIFGDVLEGQDVVNSIRLRDPDGTPPPDTEGTALNTVLIVTDPTTVETTYETPDPATQQELVDALAQITEQLPPEVPLDTEASGAFTTEQVIASVPADYQEAFTTFTETYQHQYRVVSKVNNGACDPQLGFSWLRYTVDAFATADDAVNALADGFVSDLATGNGFTETSPNHFSQPAATCSDDEGTYGMFLYTHGRYLITVEANVFNAVLQGIDVDTLLTQGVAPLFESFLTDAYMRELHSN